MSAEILEKYKKDVPTAVTENYIERHRYETMLVGCLPFEDQESYFNTLSSRTVMLLAGKEGCGKRTLETAFQKEYGEMVTDLLFFPFEELALSGEDELAEKLTEFLSAVGSVSQEDEENMYMISLGCINAVNEMPKVCSVLSHGLDDIVKNGNGGCIITAVYDGEIKDLPKSLRKTVLICRVDPPSAEERLKFFETEINSMLGYVNDTTGIDFMSEYTEGFTFDDLNDLIRNLHIFLKAKYITDAVQTGGVDLSEVEMVDIGIDRVELVKEDFIYLADNYKQEIPQTTSVSAFDMSAVTDALSKITLNAASAEEEKKPEEKSPFALLDDEDDPDSIF